MAWLESVLIVGIIFFALLALIKIVSDNRIRRKLIESGAVSENIKYLYAERMQYSVPSSLKWGLVLIGVGLAFLIGQLVPDFSGEITIACMFIFAGVGLLLFYFIARQKQSEETKK